MGIEGLIARERGVVQMPDPVLADRYVSRWSREYEAASPCPLVVREEEYFRSALTVKLQAGKDILKRSFSELGLLRPKGYSRFSDVPGRKRVPVCPLALAQLVSWAHNVPVEDVLVSKDRFESDEFLALPWQERYEILFNAYEGAHWFEYFRTEQRKRHRSGLIPKVDRSHRIVRSDLHKWFRYKYGPTQKRLCEQGFILPAEGLRFCAKGDLVDPASLAQCLSAFLGGSLDDWLEKSDPAAELAGRFVFEKLLPYMEYHGIEPFETYSTEECASMVGLSRREVGSACSKGSILNVAHEGRQLRVQGIDLALFVLKSSSKKTFTPREVEDLFCQDGLDFDALGFRKSPEGTYSRNHFVLPLYDKVARLARELVQAQGDPAQAHREYWLARGGLIDDGDLLAPVQAAGHTIHLPPWGRILYLEKYARTRSSR